MISQPCFYYIYSFILVWRGAHHGLHVEIRGQLIGVLYLPSPHGSWGSNSGGPSWCPVHLPTKASPWSPSSLFLRMRKKRDDRGNIICLVAQWQVSGSRFTFRPMAREPQPFLASLLPLTLPCVVYPELVQHILSCKQGRIDMIPIKYRRRLRLGEILGGTWIVI